MGPIRPPPPPLTTKMAGVLQTVLDLHRAPDEETALSTVVTRLQELGYQAIMFSFLRSDGGMKYIIADPNLSFGDRWQSVAPETKRALDSADILPRVLRRNQARFVLDSRNDPEGETDQALCARVGLISQYVLPIATDSLQIGTLQVDMGEHSAEPADECRVLDALAAHLSIAIERFRTRRQLSDAMQAMMNQSKIVAFEAAAAKIMHELKHKLRAYRKRLDRDLKNQEIRQNAAALKVIERTEHEVGEWVAAIETNLGQFKGTDHTCVYGIDAALRETTEMWIHTADAARAKLRFAKPEPSLAVEVRPSSLREALACLVLNAIDAHARNVWLEASASMRAVDGDDAAPHVEIVVADDGDGVPEEHVPYIREFGWTSKGNRGHGMGLTIVDMLAKQMGGWYELRSPGKSGGHPRTEFVLVLPASLQ